MGEGFRGSLATTTLESGVELVHLRIESDEAGSPPLFRLSWSHPLVSVHGFWHSDAGYDKGLRVDWGKGVYSKATSGAPVGCLYDLEGRNRLTFALSDALNPATFHAGVHEESGEVNCWVRLFDEPLGPLGVYQAALRLDTRDLPYHEALSDVSRWWAGLPGYEPAKLAAAAYGNAVVPLEGEIPATLLVVNGTLEEGVVLYLADDAGTRGIEVRDCRDRVTRTDSIGLETGLHKIDIPPAGVAVLK